MLQISKNTLIEACAGPFQVRADLSGIIVRFISDVIPHITPNVHGMRLSETIAVTRRSATKHVAIKKNFVRGLAVHGSLWHSGSQEPSTAPRTSCRIASFSGMPFLELACPAA